MDTFKAGVLTPACHSLWEGWAAPTHTPNSKKERFVLAMAANQAGLELLRPRWNAIQQQYKERRQTHTKENYTLPCHTSMLRQSRTPHVTTKLPVKLLSAMYRPALQPPITQQNHQGDLVADHTDHHLRMTADEGLYTDGSCITENGGNRLGAAYTCTYMYNPPPTQLGSYNPTVTARQTQSCERNYQPSTRPCAIPPPWPVPYISTLTVRHRSRRLPKP